MKFTRTKKSKEKSPDAPRRAFKVKDDQVVLSKEGGEITTVAEDPRLDELFPLIVEVITRLLGSAGMMRYRKDFIEKVKKVMDEKDKK